MGNKRTRRLIIIHITLCRKLVGAKKLKAAKDVIHYYGLHTDSSLETYQSRAEDNAKGGGGGRHE